MATATPPEPPQSNSQRLSWKDILLFWQMPSKEREHAEKFALRVRAYGQERAAWEQNAKIATGWSEPLADYERKSSALRHSWGSAEQMWAEQGELDKETWAEVARGYTSTTSDGVERYFAACLATVPVPAWLASDRTLHYDPANKILVFDEQLPHFGALQVRKRRELMSAVKDVPATKKESEAFCEKMSYLLVLRMLWEIAESDQMGLVDTCCCNAHVTRDDPATGQSRTDVILSVAASTEELRGIRLEKVDPEACFRGLKGLAAARIGDLVPVAPIIQFDRNDRRFVAGKEILAHTGGQNLASMDWQDFEHLIRELFEKEFASVGAEVRVTQASRDRGVDAVVFDPDPLRGGKFVVQAKRYVHTVDVSAVRDLYGTVQAEGANKGILVTTSNYGRDSYDFAKGKPLTLLNGSNLLSMLQRHGYGLRIDLEEAKRFLGQSPKQ